MMVAGAEREFLVGQLRVTTIYTIGHSTRSADDFVRLLVEFGIHRLVDVRQFPGSRRFPHFGAAALQATLSAAGIDYEHMVDLGGRRQAAGDSPNLYWKNASFRAYADYMATSQFLSALERLIEEAAACRTAIMCAEAVPWRCHRNLISDALVARGSRVEHITASRSSHEHVLNPQARIASDGVITYPLDSPRQIELF